MANLPKPQPTAGNSTDLTLRGFKVYEVNLPATKPHPHSRRDFYKIVLSTGHLIIHYADRRIEVNGTSLFFANPIVPYSVERLTDHQTGLACVFTEDFLKPTDRSASLQQSPLFKIGGTPVFALTDDQAATMTALFQKMLAEQATDYPFKGELIRTYINLIIHETLKLQPSNDLVRPQNASSRIASLFLELLERQFPIENPNHPLTLRTAHDYALQLSIHVNHLNRSVKEHTGRPTTAHIADRVISEAKALLQFTDWSISEIGYALGFDYPTHFNNFFKKMTATTPKAFRSQ
ncbi:helix-turn-helix domain-containing protein [Spirosoma sordidisoli]|uniref:Helix-turn-helix domain-containing protein n=1 Tax=Spirosoma sordidisoli TaxID=2502893 RepID=A0A4V1RVK6_9BACT|nr:helix-turn-helix domain-containing protein [Spirosoma sordidisoli]